MSVYADDDARRYGLTAKIERAKKVCNVIKYRSQKEFDYGRSVGEGKTPKPGVDAVFYEGSYYCFKDGKLFYYDPDTDCFRLSSVDRRWFSQVKRLWDLQIRKKRGGWV